VTTPPPILKKHRNPSSSGVRPTARFISPLHSEDEVTPSLDATAGVSDRREHGKPGVTDMSTKEHSTRSTRAISKHMDVTEDASDLSKSVQYSPSLNDESRSQKLRTKLRASRNGDLESSGDNRSAIDTANEGISKMKMRKEGEGKKINEAGPSTRSSALDKGHGDADISAREEFEGPDNGLLFQKRPISPVPKDSLKPMGPKQRSPSHAGTLMGRSKSQLTLLLQKHHLQPEENNENPNLPTAGER